MYGSRLTRESLSPAIQSAVEAEPFETEAYVVSLVPKAMTFKAHTLI